MRRPRRLPLWGWMLWGLWALPGSAGDPDEPSRVPLPRGVDGASASGSAEQSLAEPDDVVQVADGTGARLPADVSPTKAGLGMCEAAVNQPALNQPSVPSWTSSGDGWRSSNAIPAAGDTVVQTAGAKVSAGSSKVQEVLPSTAAASGLTEGLAARDSLQARAGVSSNSPVGHPASIPVAPGTTGHGQPPSPAPTGHRPALTVQSSSAELATAMSPMSPLGLGIPTEEGMGNLPPSNSVTALEQALEVARSALESIPGEGALGTTVHALEGITAEPCADATGPLKETIPKTGGDVSLPSVQLPSVQPVLGAKASSLVPGGASNANGLVQLDDVITVEETLGTTRPTTLSHMKQSMELSPSAISKSTAVSHAAAGLPSPEVTSELDKGSSPATARASVSPASSLPPGSTRGMPAGPGSGAAIPSTPSPPMASPHTAAGGAEGMTPPFADASSASSVRATISPISRTAGPGTPTLPAAGHDALQEALTPPAQPPPAISPADASGATAELVASASPVPITTELGEGEPPTATSDVVHWQGTAHSSPRGTSVTAGDGPPRAPIVTPLHGTVPNPDPAATATGRGHADDTSSSSAEVSTAKPVPAGSFPALENATAELVYGRNKPSSRAVRGTASPRTTGALMGTDTVLHASAAGDTPAPGVALPDAPSTTAGPTSRLSTAQHGGPSARPIPGTVSPLGNPTGALPAATALAGPGAALSEAAAGGSSPAGLSAATSLPRAGISARKAQRDVSSGATAAPSPGRYGEVSSSTADLASFGTVSPVGEAGQAFGNGGAGEGPSALSAAAGSSPGPGDATPWDTSATPAPPGPSPSTPGPAARSPLPAAGVARGPAPSKAPRGRPVGKSALHGSLLLLTPSSDTTAPILATESSDADLGSSAATAKVSAGRSPADGDTTFNPAAATAALDTDTETLQVPQHFSGSNAHVTGEPVSRVYMQHPDGTSPPLTSRSPVTSSGEMWSHVADTELEEESGGLSTGGADAGPDVPIPSPGKLRDPAVSLPAPSSIAPTEAEAATASEPLEDTSTAATTISLSAAVGTLEIDRASRASAASRAGLAPLLDENPTKGPPLGVSPSSIAPRTAAAVARSSPATLRPALGDDAPDSTTTAQPAASPDVASEEDSGTSMTHLLPRDTPLWMTGSSLFLRSGNVTRKLAVDPSARTGTAAPETAPTSAKGRSFLVTDNYATHPPPGSVAPTDDGPATASEPLEDTTTAATTVNLTAAVGTLEMSRASRASAASRAGLAPPMDESPTTGPTLGVSPSSIAPRTAAAVARSSPATLRPALGNEALHDASASPDSTTTAQSAASPDVASEEHLGTSMSHLPPHDTPLQRAAGSLSPGAGNAKSKSAVDPSAHTGTATPETAPTSAKRRLFLVTNDYIPHPGMSWTMSLQSHFGAEPTPDVPAVAALAHAAHGAGRPPSQAFPRTEPSPEPPTTGDEAPQTRSPVDVPPLAPWGGRSAPPASADASPVSQVSSLLPGTAATPTPPPASLPGTRNAATEGARGRSQSAGDGSTVQAAKGSSSVENAAEDGWVSRTDSKHISPGPSPQAPNPSGASSATQPHVSRSSGTAEPTAGASYPGAGEGTAEPAPGLTLSVTVGTEPSTSNVPPVTRSNPGSRSTAAGAVAGLSSPSGPSPTPELARAPSLVLMPSTAEPGDSVSSPVPSSTSPTVVASAGIPSESMTGMTVRVSNSSLSVATSSSPTPSGASMELITAAASLRSPRSTSRSPSEPVNSTSQPSTASSSPDSNRAQDEPWPGVSWPSTGSSQAGASTAAAWTGTRSTTALAETTASFADPSKSGTDGAASPASSEDTAVSITNTTSAEMRTDMTPPSAASLSPVPAPGVPSAAPQHSPTLPFPSLLPNPRYLGMGSTEETSSPLTSSSTTQMARDTAAPGELPSHTVPPSASSTAAGAAADVAVVAAASSTAQPAMGTPSMLTNRLMSATSTTSSLGGSPAPAEAPVGLSSLGSSHLSAGSPQQPTSHANSHSLADGTGSPSPARPTATWLPRGTVPSSNTVITAGPPGRDTSTATAVSGIAETSTARAGFAMAKATGTSRAPSPAAEQSITDRQTNRRALSRFGSVDWGDEDAIPNATAGDGLATSPPAHGAAEESTLTVPDNTAAGKSSGLSPAPFTQRATAEPTATMLTAVSKDTTGVSSTALALPVSTPSPSKAATSKSELITDGIPAQTSPLTVSGGNKVAVRLPSLVSTSTLALEGPVLLQTRPEAATVAAAGARDAGASPSQATSTVLATRALLAAISRTAVSPHLGPSITSNGSGTTVLSPAMHTTMTEPTDGSLEVPDPSHAIVVPGTPSTSKYSTTEEPMTHSSSIPSDGTTTEPASSLAVRYAAPKPTTGSSSPMAVNNPVPGQALSTSPPVTQRSLGQPVLGEKITEPTSSILDTSIQDIPDRSTSHVSSLAFATLTNPTDAQLENSTALPSSPGAPSRLVLPTVSRAHGATDSTMTSPLHIPSDGSANMSSTAASSAVLNSNAAGAAGKEPQSGEIPTLTKGLTTPQEGLGTFSGTRAAVPVPVEGGQAGSQPTFTTVSILPASATRPEPDTTDKTSLSPAPLMSAGAGNVVANTGLAESVTPAAGTITAVSPHIVLPVTPTGPARPIVTQGGSEEERGSLLGGTTTAPEKPSAATSPTTTPAFGMQKGPATAPRASGHTSSSHGNPMLTSLPEPQPTLGLSIPAVSLYPYGTEGNDRGYVERKVDFNSPLFKPEIGFPLGKTLHDSLYFTDDGQIIFPPTDNYVPSNPNPPPHGFGGQESLPMVAAFWDDADFSQGVGTTWYQEYPTLGSTQNALVHDVEAKIERYMKTSYTAKWTLKVTWEDAPAYPSQQNDTRTNTYQAVLTTDGNQSFALLLYQDGGMRWDFTKLAARNVLIGFSSGDGYAENNELIQKPPAVKYRPDQYRGYSTGLRGLWIYKLDSRPRVNYRLRCLTWLAAQPEPSSWNGELLPCPCSQSQAELDPRYRQSRDLVDASVTMLRTSSPSQTGAGVRCLYRNESFLEGWQERVWSLALNPTTDGELEAFDWCCQRVGKPLLCTRFAEKRPRASCEGYVPPAPASAFGDPHITTLDGLTYTFNGLGDFVLLMASDARTSFILQGRTAQTGTAQATNFVAFAAQYISTNTTVVEWTLGRQGDIQLLINYKPVLFSYSKDMEAKVYYSPGVLVVNGSSITAVFDGAVAISVLATSGILSVVCSLPDRYLNATKGLLGVWDHNSADDFQMLNGTSIPTNSSEEEIFSYGMTWAVGEDSLFAEPLAALVTNFTPVFLSRLRRENESQYQLAASQCHGNRECIYDVLSTGDVALGLATQSLADDFQQKKTVLNTFPPIITGNASLTAYRMDRVTRQYRVEGTGARFVPHTSLELNITENGTLTWEPTSTAPFTVSLEAVGANNLSAILLLSFTLCNCSSSHQCDYNDTSTVGSSSLQLTGCKCDDGYSGRFCQDPPDPCARGCFPGVSCHPHTGCGPCPAGLTGDGTHCADIDECAQGTVCAGNATCTNTVGSYLCTCTPSEAGAGTSCMAACGSRTCPEGFCSNGGQCHLDAATCTPTCLCPPAFTDRHCLVAGGDFQPPASPDLPRRSVRLQVRTLQNVTDGEVNRTVAAILASLEVKAFRSNTNITHTDGFTFAVVSEFAYDSTSTVIHFLNEELRGAITGAFNRPPQRRRRATAARVAFERLHGDNVTDLVKLTVPELRRYFPCGLLGYEGYQLDYTASVGFLCVSPCSTGYCRHSGHCQHLPDGPVCSCTSFSIFSPSGKRCDQLAIGLGAFLGILLGALALLALLLTSACLVTRRWRQHEDTDGANESFWRQRPFSYKDRETPS